MSDFQFPLTPAAKEGDHGPRIIRVHSAEGNVFARIMEEFPFTLPGSDKMTYTFIKVVEVPEGLSQQGAVDHFRAQGWKVEQDHGTDFNNPEWGE